LYVIAGLGNPGPEYQFTRHNLGFQTLKTLAQRHRISLEKKKFESRSGTGQIGREKVLLVKPRTYMNRSGLALKQWLQFYKLLPDRLIVVQDDLDLPWARLRIVSKGGAAGHKGILSIMEYLQEEAFIRVRLGIGRPPQGLSSEGYVLEPFSETEKKELPRITEKASQAIEAIIEEGLSAAMNRYNVRSEPNGFRTSSEGL
jgi:peptidyl-tRNA hydrolase, PTH1 family